MIGAINNSKNTFKLMTAGYITLYHFFLFSFFQTNFLDFSHKSDPKFSGIIVSFSALENNGFFDISKNDTRKEHEVNFFSIEHSNKFFLSKEETNFLTKVFAILKYYGLNYKSSEQTAETNPRSPPFLFS